MATTNSKMQQRRDTAANWTSANPILAAGEIGVEIDTDKLKVGNGTSDWVSLGYVGAGPKVYRALIKWQNTVITVTILENTLGGTITWTRTGVGVLEASSSSLFTSLKTYATISNTAESNGVFAMQIQKQDVNIYNFFPVDATLTSIDPNTPNFSQGYSVEFLVYP